MDDDYRRNRVNHVIARYRRSQGGPTQLSSYYDDFIACVANTMHEGILLLDDELVVQFANNNFCRLFEVMPEEAVGCSIFELAGGQWNVPELHRLLEKVLPQKGAVEAFEVARQFAETGHCVLHINGCRLASMPLFLLIIEDNTQRSEALSQLRELNETLEQRVEARSQQVRTLSSQLAIAERDERHRISLLLHDDLQQQLYSLLLQVTLLRQLLESGDGEEALQEAQEIEDMLQDSVRTSRNLSADLSPPILYDEGLAEAIEWLATHMNERYGLAVQVQAEASFPVRDEGLLTMLYQMVRELLFNVVKHAATSRVNIDLTKADALVRIDIRDDGLGFDPQAMARNPNIRDSGLARIRRRLHLLGGRLKINSAPGAGTRITVVAPLQFPLGLAASPSSADAPSA